MLSGRADTKLFLHWDAAGASYSWAWLRTCFQEFTRFDSYLAVHDHQRELAFAAQLQLYPRVRHVFCFRLLHSRRKTRRLLQDATDDDRQSARTQSGRVAATYPSSVGMLRARQCCSQKCGTLWMPNWGLLCVSGTGVDREGITRLGAHGQIQHSNATLETLRIWNELGTNRLVSDTIVFPATLPQLHRRNAPNHPVPAPIGLAAPRSRRREHQPPRSSST